jgi:hypothetical protein
MSVTRVASITLLFLAGLVALGAVVFGRMAAGSGGAGRVVFGALAIICLLLFVWFVSGLLFGSG